MLLEDPGRVLQHLASPEHPGADASWTGFTRPGLGLSALEPSGTLKNLLRPTGGALTAIQARVVGLIPAAVT